MPRSCWAFEGHLSRIITLWPTLADRSYVQRIEVSEQQNGRSSIRFTYRVVSKRKDVRGTRLQKVKPARKAYQDVVEQARLIVQEAKAKLDEAYRAAGLANTSLRESQLPSS